MAWQYPYPERSPSMSGPPPPPPHGGPPPPPPPPREAVVASPGRRSDGMHASHGHPPPSRSMPGSRHENEMMSYRGSHPMPPVHHHEYARGPPPPPPSRGPPPPPRGFHAESPPRYHYPPFQGGPSIHSRMSSYYANEPSPPRSDYDMDMRHSGGCTCKKSKCLKLYCQCFASSLTCGPRCKCQACHNTTMHGAAIDEARRVILERNPSAFEDKFVKDQPFPPPLPHEHVARFPYWQEHQPFYEAEHDAVGSPTRKHKSGCKCRRSYCLKKYCECFHHGARCGDMCRCINCKNKPRSEQPLSPPRRVPEPLPKEVLVNAHGAAAHAHDVRVSHDQVRVSHHQVSRHEGMLPRSDQESNSHQDTAVQQEESQEDKKSPDNKKEGDQDRMAIMAAVAMTQLFGGSSSKQENETPDTVSRLVSVEKEEEERSRQKRKAPPQEEPPKKKTKPISPTPDDEVRAVVSSGSSHVSASPSVDSHGSRECEASPRGGFPRYYGYYNTYAPRGMGPIDGIQQPILHRRSPVGDAQMNGSLPKSLSFRKICSKCGKTRGEHGELGFGNKCVYQDCGRCGAGVQMHVKANVPMGFLCCLSVKDGATPGAAEAYERKIHDLAVRAELQRGLALPPSARRVKAL